MSDSLPNFEPTLLMITGTQSLEKGEEKKAIADGEKAAENFRGGRLGGNDRELETKEREKVSISIGKLQNNLNQFLSVVGDLFIQAEQQAKITQSEEGKEVKAGIKLDQIEFSVAVNGEGEVGFWGLAQGKVGGATEIKLTFKRGDA